MFQIQFMLIRLIERIRKIQPENNKELQIVGLIHDLGMYYFHLEEPPWAISLLETLMLLGVNFKKYCML